MIDCWPEESQTFAWIAANAMALFVWRAAAGSLVKMARPNNGGGLSSTLAKAKRATDAGVGEDHATVSISTFQNISVPGPSSRNASSRVGRIVDRRREHSNGKQIRDRRDVSVDVWERKLQALGGRGGR